MSQVEDLERRLELAKSVQERIDLMNLLAWELRDLDKERGTQLARSASELSETEQYKKGINDSQIALCQFDFMDNVQALTQGLKCLAVFEQLGDLSGQARALYTLCWAHWGTDNFSEAVEMGQRAQLLAHQIDDQPFEVDVLNNLGLAYKRSGNYEDGYAAYQAGLVIARKLGDQVRECKILVNIARALASQEKYEQALEYAQASLDLKVQTMTVNGYSLLVLGEVHLGLKHLEQAMHFSQQALEFGDQYEIAQLSLAALYTIGQIGIEEQNFDHAVAYLQQALALAEKIKSNLYIFMIHQTLSSFFEKRGDLSNALKHYKAFHSIKERVFNDKNASRLQSLQIHHQIEMARREAEIYHLRNIELEQEIAERKRIEDQLQIQATTDALTGISNRRQFFQMAGFEINRAPSLNAQFVLAIIDIDHFKKINDQYGHNAGDQALIGFIRTVAKNVRIADLFARLGGDEFVLLFPNTELSSAYKILERVRYELLTQPVLVGERSVSLTISVGLTYLIGLTDTLDSLLERADQALYMAKNAGRNQICVA